MSFFWMNEKFSHTETQSIRYVTLGNIWLGCKIQIIFLGYFTLTLTL